MEDLEEDFGELLKDKNIVIVVIDLNDLMGVFNTIEGLYNYTKDLDGLIIYPMYLNDPQWGNRELLN